MKGAIVKNEMIGNDKFTVIKKQKVNKKSSSYCKNFQTGKCPYGEKCNFVHEKDPRWRSVLCNYIKNGAACPNGEKCSFSHEAKAPVFSLSIPDGFDSKIHIPFCVHYHTQGKTCAKGESCIFSHYPFKVKTQLCEEFFTKKTCSRGAKCFFVHEEQFIQKRPDFDEVERTELCQYHFTGKFCKYGINCNRAHRQEDLKFYLNNSVRLILGKIRSYYLIHKHVSLPKNISAGKFLCLAKEIMEDEKAGSDFDHKELKNMITNVKDQLLNTERIFKEKFNIDVKDDGKIYERIQSVIEFVPVKKTEVFNCGMTRFPILPQKKKNTKVVKEQAKNKVQQGVWGANTPITPKSTSPISSPTKIEKVIKEEKVEEPEKAPEDPVSPVVTVREVKIQKPEQKVTNLVFDDLIEIVEVKDEIHLQTTVEKLTVPELKEQDPVEKSKEIEISFDEFLKKTLSTAFTEIKKQKPVGMNSQQFKKEIGKMFLELLKKA